MEVNFTKEALTLLAVVSGRLDSSTVHELEAGLKENLPGMNELIFDFSGLEYISSAGLRVLLASYKLLAGNMLIRNANRTITDIFKITGMSMIFPVE